MLEDVKAVKEEEETEKQNHGRLPRAFDIYDELDTHSSALVALGELLYTSSLHTFSDEDLGESVHVTRDERADNCRFGLKKIIELYLREQERIVLKHCEQLKASFYYKLKDFEYHINLFKSNQNGPISLSYLEEKMQDINCIIMESEELRARALEAQKEAFKLFEKFKPSVLFTKVEFPGKKNNIKQGGK